MKRFFLFVVLIAALLTPAFSQDFRYNLNVGNIGLGGFFPFYNASEFEGMFSLMNFGIEERTTNLGLELNPYRTVFNENDDGEYLPFSILNLNLYWNALNINFAVTNIYMGPFISASFIFFGEKTSWDKYVISAGMQMGFRYNIGNMNYNIISVKTGYRLDNGRNGIYVGVEMDLIVFFIMVLYSTPYYYY